MSENPASIIEEYLELVREKLPESIADDVITELETYMMETASELGEDGQITVESAKKVVAQFGAPGEVADEYKFSMLPETIPEKDVPPEIIQQPEASEPSLIESQQPQQVTRQLGVDPTSSPTEFFIKASILSIFWITFATIPSTFLGPLGYLSWMSSIFLAPTFIVIILISGFMLLAFDRKWQRTILWKRSYPEWSQLQVFVTLPENSIPASRLEYRVMDIFLSLCGILLFAPYVIHVYNGTFSLLLAIPALILFFARIYLIGRKMSEKRDPLELANYEFGCNFSLLVILNASFGWVFATQLASTSLQIYLRPLHAIYVILFGVVLLFNLVTGAQNLWWKSEKDEDERSAQIMDDDRSVSSVSSTEESLEKKRKTVSEIPNLGKNLIAKIALCIIAFNIVVLYLAIYLWNLIIWENLIFTMFTWMFGSVCLGMILAASYLGFRSLFVKHWNSTNLVGRRSRAEAALDLVVSIFILFGFGQMLIWRMNPDVMEYLWREFYSVPSYNIQLALQMVALETIGIVLALLSVLIRIPSDFLQFSKGLEIHSLKYLEASGIVGTVALSLLLGYEFAKYIIVHQHFSAFLFDYTSMLFFILYLAFQVGASGVRLKELKQTDASQRIVNSRQLEERNNHSSIAN